MKQKALVLALLSATISVPGAAHAADDNICSQLLIYAINQFCQLLPNGQSLCQPVALAGPSPSCELPDAQASMVQVPVGPPALQFPTFPTFGGTPNYFPPGAFPQFPNPQFPYPQFPYQQFPYPQFTLPQFPVAQNPLAGNPFQPPALPVFPYPDYPNPYFPFTANPSAPPQYANPAVPAVPAAAEQPASAAIAASNTPVVAATTPDMPVSTAPTPPPSELSSSVEITPAPAAVETPAVSVAMVEAPPTLASAQPAITSVEPPATSVITLPTAAAPVTAAPPVADTASAMATSSAAPDTAPVAAIADATMPASAADQAAAAEKARLDALAHFEFDSAELTPRGRAMLDEWLAKATSNAPILVTGHADRLGPEPYNEKLSLLRAQAVKQYLTEQGKPAQHIEIKAKGERIPLIDCAGDASPETKACLAPNRRAEVVFKPLAKPARKAVKPVSRIVQPGSKR